MSALRPSSSSVIVAVGTLGAVGLAASLDSTVCTWNEPAGGNWSEPSSWDPPEVPDQSGEAALIPDDGEEYVVDLDMNVAIDWLDLQNPEVTLRLNGSTLATSLGFMNAGRVVANTTPARIEGDFENGLDARLDVESGLTFSGPFMNWGPVYVDVGAMLALESDYVQEDGRTVVHGDLAIDGIFDNQAGSIRGHGLVTTEDVRITHGFITPGEWGPPVGVGTLEIDGDLTYASPEGGGFWLDLGGAEPSEYDVLTVSGVATLGGSLVVEAQYPFIPQVDQEFTFLQAMEIAGAFDEVSGHGVYDVLYDYPAPGQATVRCVESPNPFDLNADGLVGFLDLIWILTAWGPCESPCPPDVNGDGMVSSVDLILILANWTP